MDAVEFTTFSRQSRKKRRCIECKTEVARGEDYIRRTGIYDGQVYADDVCPECHTFQKLYKKCKFLEHDGYEFTRGELINEVSEALDYIHPVKISLHRLREILRDKLAIKLKNYKPPVRSEAYYRKKIARGMARCSALYDEEVRI